MVQKVIICLGVAVLICFPLVIAGDDACWVGLTKSVADTLYFPIGGGYLTGDIYMNGNNIYNATLINADILNVTILNNSLTMTNQLNISSGTDIPQLYSKGTITIDEYTSGAGNTYITFAEGGTKRWSLGNDANPNNYFSISSGGDLTSEKLVIDTSGNVGIGTDNPEDELHVKSSASTKILVEATNANSLAVLGIGTDLGTNHGFLIAYGSAHGTFPKMTALKNNYGDLGFFTGTAAPATEKMRIDTDGNVGIGDSTPEAPLKINPGEIQLQQKARFTPISGAANSGIYTSKQNTSLDDAFDQDANLILQSASAANRHIAFITGSTPSTKMIIEGTGNVGIGTTTPYGKLDIANGHIFLNNAYGIAFRNSANEDNDIFSVRARSDNLLTFRAGDSDRMFIDTAGNVGIATTTPTSKLHIIGNAKIQGNLNVTGCIIYNSSGTPVTLGDCI
jgi:hypothetical protein